MPLSFGLTWGKKLVRPNADPTLTDPTPPILGLPTKEVRKSIDNMPTRLKVGVEVKKGTSGTWSPQESRSAALETAIADLWVVSYWAKMSVVVRGGNQLSGSERQVDVRGDHSIKCIASGPFRRSHIARFYILPCEEPSGT